VGYRGLDLHAAVRSLALLQERLLGGQLGLLGARVPNEDIPTAIGQRLQLIPGGQVPQDLALLIAPLHLVREHGLRIPNEEVHADGKGGHVEGEGPLWSPGGIEAGHLGAILGEQGTLHHQAADQAHRPDAHASPFDFAHLGEEFR